MARPGKDWSSSCPSGVPAQQNRTSDFRNRRSDVAPNRNPESGLLVSFSERQSGPSRFSEAGRSLFVESQETSYRRGGGRRTVSSTRRW